MADLGMTEELGGAEVLIGTPSLLPNLLIDPEADLLFILRATPGHTEALMPPSQQRLLQGLGAEQAGPSQATFLIFKRCWRLNA